MTGLGRSRRTTTELSHWLRDMSTEKPNGQTETQNPVGSSELVRCPECQALSGHCITCSLQTVEEKAAQAMQYYNAWLRDREQYSKLCLRYREQITLWQGKHALLRRENNALRRKIKRQTPNAPGEPRRP